MARRSTAAVLAGALLSSALLFPGAASAIPDDPDNDELSTPTEAQYGTNPRIMDTDSDGFSDGFEVLAQYDILTDPLKADTDGDGLSDRQEQPFNLKTNARVADTDGDGKSDGEEVNVLKTDPLTKDQAAPAEAQSPTPTGSDTDGDGLSDKDELKFFTNLFVADSDFDGVSDGDEVKNGTNPLNVFSN